MIFVTVGTHEQQFNRLVRYVDILKKNGVINEKVVIQTGYSTYEPICCEWQSVYPYDKMNYFMKEARIIITHGGPASFIMAIQEGKIPIVMPRQEKYDEHVNNHQLEFCREVDERMGNIILVEEIDDLRDTILNYNKIISKKSKELLSNNEEFNDKLEHLVKETMKVKN